MTVMASEIAYSSALKMLALFGSLVVLVTFPVSQWRADRQIWQGTHS